MSDHLDRRLQEYADRWRAGEPPPAPLAAPRRGGRRPLVAVAAAVVVLAAGSVVAVQMRDSGSQNTVGLTDQTTEPALDKCAGRAGKPWVEPVFDGRLPADFHPVSVFDCWTAVEPVANDGTWLVLQERRTDDTATIGELATTLRLPDEEPGDTPADQGCRLDRAMSPEVLLIDAAGREFTPQPPMGYCGKPRKEVVEAYQDMTQTMRVVASQRTEQVETREAQQSGCSDTWKDMANIGDGQAKPAYQPWTPPTVERACLYVLNADEPDVGRRKDGGPVNDQDAARLADLLSELPAEQPCNREHQFFSALHLAGGGFAYVEMDGCYRVLVDGHGWYQGNAELASAIREIAARWGSAPPKTRGTSAPAPTDKGGLG